MQDRARKGSLIEHDPHAERATMYKLYDPPEFEALKKVDAQQHRLGQPNVFDIV